MTLSEFLILFAVGFAGTLLWSSLKAREAANDAMRRVCAREGWLFLDDTVALASMWPARDRHGHFALRRVYGFDYSDTGHERRHGTVTLLGNEVLAVDVGVGVPEGATRH